MVLPDDIITRGPTSPVELKGVGSSRGHAQWGAWPFGRGRGLRGGGVASGAIFDLFSLIISFPVFFINFFLTLFIKLWLKGGADKQWPYANEGGVASLPR